MLVLDKRRVGWYVISSSRVERLMEDGRAVTYVRNLNGGGQALAIKTGRPPWFTPTSSTVDRPELAARSICSQVGMEVLCRSV